MSTAHGEIPIKMGDIIIVKGKRKGVFNKVFLQENGAKLPPERRE
jgi:hypothetical protein